MTDSEIVQAVRQLLIEGHGSDLEDADWEWEGDFIYDPATKEPIAETEALVVWVPRPVVEALMNRSHYGG